MNKLLSKRFVFGDHKKTSMSLMSCRSLAVVPTFMVSPTGEKIAINTGKALKITAGKKEKWQRVRPMGYEPELREIKKIEFDHRLESDPKVAKETASARLQSLKDSLLSRGFCRETKPYNPPKDVQKIMETVCHKVIPKELMGQKWSEVSLEDMPLKYKLLTECHNQFNYEIPNSLLYLMTSVSDVLDYYSTPIRGITSYDQMSQNSDEMPTNLHVIAEPIRYNPDNDTFFGGVNAYPFSALKVQGLKSKKKYPKFKSPFVWPDI